jgi:hypothetical protein
MSSSTLTRPDFIAANQVGQIPEAQRKALPGQSRVGLLFGGLFALVMGALIVATLVALGSSGPSSGAFFGLSCTGLLLLLVVGPFWARGMVRAFLVRQDLREGRVEQADGHVIWQRSRYRARFPGQRPWSESRVDELEPGSYHFYYLTRSGQLLSAQPRPGFSGVEATTLGQVMARVFGASPEDLAANRAGRLAPRQAVRVLVSGLSAGLVAIGLGLFGLWWIFPVAGNLFDRVCLIIIALLICGLGSFFVSLAALNLLQDALGGQVRSSAGVVNKSRTGGRAPSFHFDVNGQKLQVSYRHYLALFPGHRGRVNYTPRSKYVVSVEVVD